MKSVIKYSFTLLFCLGFTAFALLAPQVADHWYDRQTMEHLSYETMEFKACEIRPYQSFSDQVNALSRQVTEGIAPYAVQLREREDALSDQEMVEIVNEELKKLYQKKILPREITVNKLENRCFYQLYAMPLDSGGTILEDICYWTLTADTAEGSMVLSLDSTYHKIYGYRLTVPLNFDDTVSMETAKNYGNQMTVPPEVLASPVGPWINEQQEESFLSVAKAWCSYWELSDAGIHTEDGASLYEKESDKSSSYESAVADDHAAIDVSLGIVKDYEVVFTDGSSFQVLNRLENPWMYYGKGGDWVIRTGMGIFLMVM